MGYPSKTNLLAIVSFSGGLFALLSMALLLLLLRLQTVPGNITVVIIDTLLISLRNIGMVVAAATGILALGQIRQGVDGRKGKMLVVIGIALLLFQILVGLAFLLGPILQ
ncbi:MAG: hypothetical protein ACUVSY_08570 [Roseiflexus sp.]